SDPANGTFTSLPGPNYSENSTGQIGTGTIILNAPAGFIFDTGGTAPTVAITTTSGGSSTDNVQGSVTARSSTQLTFTVTRKSQNSARSKLTWQNLRVRPVAGTPLASGYLSPSGTARVVGPSPHVNPGHLRERAG